MRQARLFVLVALLCPMLALAAVPGSGPTFSKDVAPILFENCVTCHRPGQIAPMSRSPSLDSLLANWARCAPGNQPPRPATHCGMALPSAPELELLPA